MKISRIDTPRCQVGEGPVWDVASQALYFIDILGRRVLRYDPADASTRVWPVPSIVGSLALREQGGAVVALVDGIYALDFDTGACTPFALPAAPDPRVQFADGKVDRRGRFVVGTSDRAMQQPLGGLYSLAADQRLRAIDGDIILSNGPCWSPDDKIFYHADSVRQTIYAYDYNIETGAVANRRAWASTAELGGIPDGATVDSDGLLWMAICEAGKVVAFRPDGTLERVIDMPVKLPGSVMFGGDNLDRLFVPTLSPGFLGRSAAPEDGCTFVIDGLGARGLPEPRYVG